MTMFTEDWTSRNDKWWREILPKFPAARDILEIGTYEGRTAVWLLEYFPDSRITCIDTFQGSWEHEGVTGLEAHFDVNVAPFGARVEKIVAASGEGLTLLGLARRRFDFIYVDASHEPADAYIDCTLAWPLLRRGGLMITDDYEWPAPDGHDPKDGYNAFFSSTPGKSVIAHGYQIIIQKD